MEILDIYDENKNFIGKEERTIVHKLGIWHETFHCWILSRKDDKNYVLFQKRHPSKDTSPNLYDITSAGHLASGETAEDGVRELEEELGIKVEFEKLIFICNAVQSIKTEKYIDNEFPKVYFYESNKPLENYKLQEEELTGIVKIELKDIIKLFNKEIGTVEAMGIERIDSNYEKVNIRLSIVDFVPHGKEYYLEVFNKIQGYAEKLCYNNHIK